MSTVQKYAVPSDPKGYRWEVLYRTPENRATRKRGFKTKRDAEAWQTKMESDKQKGAFVAQSAGRVTVDQVGAEWKLGRGHLRASTIANSETAWNRVSARWGSVQVGSVTKSAVKAWVAAMVKEGLGVESIENAFSVLRQVMDTAVDNHRAAANPCLGVKLPKRAHHDLMCLTHEQVATLAKQVHEQAGDRYGTVIRTLAYTGLRWNELASLRVRSIDFDRRRLEIVEGVTEVKGELEWGNTKTHTRRSVPIPDFLADELRAWIVGKRPDAVVFTGRDGSVLRVSNFRPRVFNPAIAACIASDPHFPRTTLRKLRNTAASLAIQAGANPKTVQLMLGHKSAAMTLDVYSALFPSDLDNVAERLNDRAVPPSAAVATARMISALTADLDALDALVERHDEISAGHRRDLTTARTRLQGVIALLGPHAAGPAT